jgi:hypothetical protein
MERLAVVCLVLTLLSAGSEAGIAEDIRLWKIRTDSTLPAGQASFATWYDRIHRNPGNLTINTLETGISFGITDRLQTGISFEAYKRVSVGGPEQLSFGQQRLGFFGDKTPGSPPLPSELVSGSSRVPQLRSPENPSGTLMGNAGYYNLLPFAGLVPSGSAAGFVTLDVKYRILSESSGGPFGLAIRSYFSVPIHKGIDFLMTHPVGTADLQFGFDAIVSRSIGETADVYWNGGYLHISQPAHASVFRLRDALPVSIGFAAPRSGRVRLIAESTTEVFIGEHTPNSPAGSQDPVDITVGAQVSIAQSMVIGAGYRRLVNQAGGNRDGFVVSFSREFSN